MTTFLEKRIALQHVLAVKEDGHIGPATRAAFEAVADGMDGPSFPPLPDDPSRVDDRSERNIVTLHPRVQGLARKLIRAAAAAGITAKATSGTRSYAEQTALYNQPHDGQDNDGDGRVDEADEKVTNAPAGYSNHNFGLAFDLTVFVGAQPKWDGPEYAQLGRLGESIGLNWGGRWAKPDEPHFELHPEWAGGMSEADIIAELRSRHAAGRDAFA
jgi:peptidoglycan L-alanyl-D-glutamate endopeptidase CwlK